MTTYSPPFAINNIRCFIAFRVFFNARFYYPVFTILFLDYGLTIEQFAILNSVWAATIVLAEVPSGALADLLGRKQLLLVTSFLMMSEMALLSFVPIGNIQLVFWAFLLNRIFSGLAEAMASGADEALAYDSLIKEGNKDDWPKVLSLMMRIKAVAAMITMSFGALTYDPDIVNRVLQWLGSDIAVSQQMSMRYPVYLTLALSLLSCMSVMLMKETHPLPHSSAKTGNQLTRLLEMNKMTWKAGKWILGTPFALAVILLAMTYDHCLRMLITMTSQYFRLINLPESTFGLIGAGMSLLGVFLPKLAEKMVKKYTPLQNMYWLSALTLLGILGLTGFIPYIGILPMACVSAGIMLTSFFTSHYLNRITPSHLRATILSFKGLAFNLAYGAIGMLFAALIYQLRQSNGTSHPDWSTTKIEDNSFIDAIGWFPWYTVIILIAVLLLCWYRLQATDIHKQKG